MKKKLIISLITLITILCSAFSVSAQSFIVSDVQFGSDVSEDKKQRALKEWLGAQIDLQFFDNNVKMTNEEKEVLILDKINSTTYGMSRNNDKVVLKLNTLIAYIRSFTYTVYEDNQKKCVMTAKRK